jgi:hypothetical protein
MKRYCRCWTERGHTEVSMGLRHHNAINVAGDQHRTATVKEQTFVRTPPTGRRLLLRCLLHHSSFSAN